MSAAAADVAARRTVASRVLRALEVPVLLAVPLSLAVCALLQIRQTAILTLAVGLVAVLTQVAGFETSRPPLRQVMPSVVLGSVAAAGRLLFAPLPNVKPVSAICIMAGSVFGRQSGFMVGALAAVVSNMILGQGPWTPWQMYTWGMVGYVAGILGDHGLLDRKPVLYGFGFFSGIAFGLVMDSWNIISYVHPLTWPSALITYAAGMPSSITHAVATVVFLRLIYAPWSRKLGRVKRKYGLRAASEEAVARRRAERAVAFAQEGSERHDAR